MRTRPLALAAVAAVAVSVAAPPASAQLSQAVIFNNARNDGGFNQMASDGLARFEAEHPGSEARTAIVSEEAQKVQRLTAFARAGVSHIVVNGFANQGPVQEVASAFPDVRFTIIDGVVDLPNVRSVLFAEHEAGFLAGVAAASREGVDRVAAVGAMDIPPIARFACGFKAGAQAVNPNVPVDIRIMATAPTAFRDRDGAERIAREMIDAGADVVFAVAGPAGAGVHEAAARTEALSVGVDVDETAASPRVLTSAMKRVDVAAYDALKAAHDGSWTPGLIRLGLAQGGVGVARSEANEALFAPVAAEVERFEARIRSGDLVVEAPASVTGCGA